MPGGREDCGAGQASRVLPAPAQEEVSDRDEAGAQTGATGGVSPGAQGGLCQLQATPEDSKETSHQDMVLCSLVEQCWKIINNKHWRTLI